GWGEEHEMKEVSGEFQSELGLQFSTPRVCRRRAKRFADGRRTGRKPPFDPLPRGAHRHRFTLNPAVLLSTIENDSAAAGLSWAVTPSRGAGPPAGRPRPPYRRSDAPRRRHHRGPAAALPGYGRASSSPDGRPATPRRPGSPPG